MVEDLEKWVRLGPEEEEPMNLWILAEQYIGKWLNMKLTR